VRLKLLFVRLKLLYAPLKLLKDKPAWPLPLPAATALG
jgi:hypothetical protein